MIRSLAAAACGVLVRVGMCLEDAAGLQPDVADTGPCAHCRDRIVLTMPQLAGMVRNGAKGVPMRTIALEAQTLYWTPGED